MDADAEQRGELPVEVVFGESRDAAEQVDIEIVVEMLIDIGQHPLHAGMIATGDIRLHPYLLGTDHG